MTGRSKVSGIVLTAWLAMAVTAGCARAQATLPNGLALVRFEVRAPEPAVAGSTVSVEMTLKNVSGTPMQFDPNIGIFVGARVNSTSDANARDFGNADKGLVLPAGREVTLRATRALDTAGAWRFWPAFRLNGQWGPFRWMEKTLQVYGSAAEARSQSGSGSVAGTLKVAQLLANPAMYDGKKVTVVGDALIVRQQTDSTGAPWALISLVDIDNAKLAMNVVGTGRAPLSNGDVARATGIFRVKSRRGRYTYDNELICDSGGIVKDQRQTAQKQTDEQAGSRPVVDVRKTVGRQLDLGLLKGRVVSTGAEVRVQFQTRTYSQTPRRNTIVATGRGAAAVRVESTERREQPGGKGSTLAGPGNTWLVVHVWVRGAASNAGMPDSFAQSFIYYDPAPVFFVVGRDGTVYWPDSSWSSAVSYQTKSDRTLSDIRMNNVNWIRTGLALKVPKTIQEPTLVVLTYAGPNRCEYSGIRLN
jgi:hypothetical protein